MGVSGSRRTPCTPDNMGLAERILGDLECNARWLP